MKAKLDAIGAAYAIAGMAVTLILTQTAWSETAITNEYWISTSTNTANLGTLANPFDGSTQANFDSWLNWLPANSTLHILAGTYDTAGNTYTNTSVNVKTGQKILGSGMDSTIIRLNRPAQDQARLFASPLGTNMEVCDLTCDANSSPTNPYTYYGCTLYGTKCAIRRVKAINLGHYGGSSETFGLAIGTKDPGGNILNVYSEGNIIEECEVSQLQATGAAGFITAISIGGVDTTQISGIIRNNRIFLTAVTDNGQHAIGIGSDGLIEGNYVDGAGEGVYSDTGFEGTNNLLIAHNMFKNVLFGVSLRTYKQNVTIAYNTVSLSTNTSAQYGFWFPHDSGTFGTYPGQYYTNVTIYGNTVLFENSSVHGSTAFLSCYGISGFVVANNQCDSGMTLNIPGCLGTNFFNNFDLNGNPLTGLTQTKPPNGLVRKTVNASPYNATYADRYIAVKTTAATTINLPTTKGHPGKEFIIMKEVGNANNVTINPAGTEKINGATTLVVGGGYGNREVISDGTNWFAR